MCIWCLDISEYIEITFLHSVKTNFTIKITVQWGYTATAIRLVRSLSHGEHQLLLGSGGAPFSEPSNVANGADLTAVVIEKTALCALCGSCGADFLNYPNGF